MLARRLRESAVGVHRHVSLKKRARACAGVGRSKQPSSASDLPRRERVERAARAWRREGGRRVSPSFAAPSVPVRSSRATLPFVHRSLRSARVRGPPADRPPRPRDARDVDQAREHGDPPPSRAVRPVRVPPRPSFPHRRRGVPPRGRRPGGRARPSPPLQPLRAGDPRRRPLALRHLPPRQQRQPMRRRRRRPPPPPSRHLGLRPRPRRQRHLRRRARHPRRPRDARRRRRRRAPPRGGRVDRVGIWGRSMGAVTALLYANRDPSIAGIVLDSPFSSLTALMSELVDDFFSASYVAAPRAATRLALGWMRSSIKARAGFDIHDLDVLRTVESTHCPALFAHGADDDFIRPAHSRALRDAYAGEKEFFVFDGDHNSPRPTPFFDATLVFFTRAMYPGLDGLGGGGDGASGMGAGSRAGSEGYAVAIATTPGRRRGRARRRWRTARTLPRVLRRRLRGKPDRTRGDSRAGRLGVAPSADVRAREARSSRRDGFRRSRRRRRARTKWR